MLRTPNLRTPAAKQGIAVAVAVIVAAAVGAVFAVGRGDGGGSEHVASTGAGVVNRNDGGSGSIQTDDPFQRFAQCLEEQGVTLPQPGTRGQLPDEAELRSAFEACQAYAPDPRGRAPFGPHSDDGDGTTPDVPGLPPDDSGGGDSNGPTL